MKIFARFAALLGLITLLLLPALPAYAFGYPWTGARFSLYKDGNNNDQMDMWGYDTCVRGATGTLTYQIHDHTDNTDYTVAVIQGDDFLIDSYGDWVECAGFSNPLPDVVKGDRYITHSGCGGHTQQVYLGYSETGWFSVAHEVFLTEPTSCIP